MRARSSAECRQVGAFGQVLAQQPVGRGTSHTHGVLVRSALPGAVRVTEVDRDAGGDGEVGVVGHFLAPVLGGW
jgi:hypothetical protein